MGDGVWHLSGGIRSLHRLLTEHGEAVEFDLITLGLRLRWLGTERLTWRDLLVIVRHCTPSSALARSVAGPEVTAWNTGTITAWLLASVTDLLQVANWQRGGDEDAARPSFIPRPSLGDEDEEDERARVLSGRGEPMTFDELDRRLGWTDRSPRT